MDCRETVTLGKSPNFCPHCGSTNIKVNDLMARSHANDIVEEMKRLKPEVELAWNTYVEVYVEFENRRRLLNNYARRGYIDSADIPVIEQKRLIDALYEYRAKRKESKKIKQRTE